MEAANSSESPDRGGGRMAVGLLVALNVLAYLAGLFIPSLREAMMLHGGGDGIAGCQAWQWTGYTFVHSGLSHLFFNMLFLWYAGVRCCVERGVTVFLGAYLCGAVGGACGFMLSLSCIPGINERVLCGASSAVLGVCGAMLPLSGEADAGLSAVCRILPAGLSRSIPPGLKLRTVMWGIIITTIAVNPVAAAFATHACGVMAGMAFGFIYLILSPAGRREGRMERHPEMIPERILEKLRHSGYASLTSVERNILRKRTGRQG